MPEKKKNYTKEKKQLLDSLINQSKKKGYIHESTITAKFSRYSPTDPEMENVFAEFEKEGIEIIFSDEDDDLFISANSKEEEDDDIDVPPSTAHSSSLTDPLKLYLNEIHKFPTLSHKDIMALVKKIQDGDMDAREYMINCNLKFAFMTATKYARTGLPLLDLIQQANIGLMSAVDKYNPNRGSKFTSYAVFWIKQSILAYIKDNIRMVKTPACVFTDLSKVAKARQAYYSEHCKYPTDDELATLTGLTIARVKYLKDMDFDIISTEDQPDENMPGTYKEILSATEEEDPSKEMYLSECRIQIKGFLLNLPERERLVIELRFGLSDDGSTQIKSLSEIGNLLGLSKERVRQIEERALLRLRKMPNIATLYDYLDI